MTVTLPLIDQPAPITCGCLSDDRLILVRSNGSVEMKNLMSDTSELSTVVPFFIVAVTGISRENFFASVDSSLVVRLHAIQEGQLITERVFEPYFRHAQGAAGTASQYINFQLDYCGSWNSLVFRPERIDSDMSLDHHRKRILGDVYIMDVNSGDRKSLFTTNEGEIPVSYCLMSERVIVLSRMHSHYKLEKISKSNSQSVAIPPTTAGKLGDELIGIETFDGRVIIVGTAAIGIFDIDLESPIVRLISVAPIATAIVARKSEFLPPTSPMCSARSPRINPALNVYRKHSTVPIAPSIGDAILGLGLGSHESRLESCGYHSISVPKRFSRFFKLGNFVMVYSHGVAHLVDLKIGFSTPIETMRYTAAFSTAGKTAVLVGGSHYTVVDVDDPFSAFQAGISSPPQPAVALASLDDKLLLSLRSGQMDFTFLDSVQARSVFDFSHFPFLNIFQIASDIIVSSVGYTGVIRLVASSPTAAISLESGVSPIHDFEAETTFSAVDVSNAWAGTLRMDVYTIGIHRLEDSFVQITEFEIFKDGISVMAIPNGTDSVIVGHCACGSTILVLVSNGDIWELSSSGSVAIRSTGIADATCITTLDQSVYIGTFYGYVATTDMRAGGVISTAKLSESSIECIETTDEYVIVTSRGSELILASRADSVRSPHTFDLPHTFRIAKLSSVSFLIHGYDGMYVLDTECVTLRSVALGHTGSVGNVSIIAEEGGCSVLIPLLESNRLVRVNLDLQSTTATYAKSLPFSATEMALCNDGTAFILGWLNRMQQAALLVLSVDNARVGLIGTKDAVSVSFVIPFDTLKEEPVCLSLWQQAMFPDGGLLAVGTKGKSRGRLILFERRAMSAVAKTSIPSLQVSCIAPLSSSIIAIGCEDCVAILSLKPGPRSMPALLSTVAVFNTYSLVRSLTVIDEERFLAITENGNVQLLLFSNANLVVSSEATLECPYKVHSRCYLVPWAQQFACTSEDGELRIYSYETVMARDAGLMKLVSTHRIGSSITAGCTHGEKLVLALSNGSTIELTRGLNSIRASS